MNDNAPPWTSPLGIEESIIAMARALRRCEALQDETKRAAAYIAADVCCHDWWRYDHLAAAYEATRRELVAAGALRHD